MSIRRGCEPTNRVWIYKIKEGKIPQTEGGNLPWEKVIDNFDAKYDFIANNGSEFFFCTTLDASRKRIIAFDVVKKTQREIIPEHKTNVIEGVAVLANDYLLVEYLEDVKEWIQFRLKTS